MKISLTKRELKRLYGAVKLVLARSHVAVLQHIMLRAVGDRVTIHATNLEEHLRGEVDGEVRRDGSALVPVQVLKDLCQGNGTDVVTFEVANNENAVSEANPPQGEKSVSDEVELLVTSPVAGQPITRRVRSLSVSEWPAATVDVEMQRADTAALLSVYRRVLPAASKDQTRYALNGVYADTDLNQMVATDGRRMFVAVADVKRWPSVTWPTTKVLASDLLHATDAQLGVVPEVDEGDNKRPAVLAIAANGWHYQTNCVQAKFANYRTVIPSAERFTLQLDLAADAAVVRQVVQGFGLVKGAALYLYIDAQRVCAVHRLDGAFTYVELPNSRLVGSPGESGCMVLAWNSEHLLDTLAAGFTTMHIQSEHGEITPFRCSEPEGQGFAVVMPMRLSDDERASVAEHFAAWRDADALDAEMDEEADEETDVVPQGVDAKDEAEAVAKAEAEPNLNNQNDNDNNNDEENTPMHNHHPNTLSTAQPPHAKPDLTLYEKPEASDPIADLDALLNTALASLQDTRDHLLAVKKQAKVLKSDLRQKERDTRSTQILLDKLKNAAGF